MAFENRPSPLHVGIGNVNLPVKTTWTHQFFIEVFSSIRCGDDHNSLAALKTIHGREQSIDGLLVFGVRFEFSVFTNAIDFINEDDGWLITSRLTEELADAFGTDPDKHLGEIATMSTEETGLGFTGDRFGQHGFAGPGGTNQKNTLGQVPAQ